MIIKIIVGKYPGAGLFSSPAKALILCTHFQGKEWGGKKKKKERKKAEFWKLSKHMSPKQEAGRCVGKRN